MLASETETNRRYSFDLGSYLENEPSFEGQAVGRRLPIPRWPSTIDEDDEWDLRTSVDRSSREQDSNSDMTGQASSKLWSNALKSTSKLQRNPSTLDRLASPNLDHTAILRKSPVEFEKDFSVPVPRPPRDFDSTLRPAAARNASSGSGRKQSMKRPKNGLRSTTPMSTYQTLDGTTAVSINRAVTKSAALRARFPKSETSELPIRWNVTHDRAICVLDARNYGLEQSIRKLRRTFPELDGFVLTPNMIDRRLRTLDQDIECDYWKAGLDLPSGRMSIERRTRQDSVVEHFAVEGAIEPPAHTSPVSLEAKGGTPNIREKAGCLLGLSQADLTMSSIVERQTSLDGTVDNSDFSSQGVDPDPTITKGLRGLRRLSWQGKRFSQTLMDGAGR